MMLSSSSLIYLQAALERTQHHLDLMLEQHVPLIKDSALQPILKDFLLAVKQQLSDTGKLSSLVNEVMLLKVDVAIEAFLKETLVPFSKQIKVGNYTETDKACIDELLKSLNRQFKGWKQEALLRQQPQGDNWLMIRPWVEQRLCHEKFADAMQPLLTKLKELFTERYADDNELEEEADKHPSCFISYAWPLLPVNEHDESWTQEFVIQLAKDLKAAGINVRLDVLESQGGKDLVAWMKRMVDNCDYVMVIGTQSLHTKYYDPERYKPRVGEELSHLSNRIGRDHELNRQERVFGTLLSGSEQQSFPQELSHFKTTRSFQTKSYLQVLKQLLSQFYAYKTQAHQFEACWDNWLSTVPAQLKTVYEGLEAQAVKDFYERLLQAKLQRKQLHADNSRQMTSEMDPFPTQAVLPFYHNLPWPKNPAFTGRQDALKALAEQLQQNQVSAIVQTVQGLGGIGKSQLAVHYAYESLEQKKYQLVWWLDAKNIINGYLDLADYLKIAKELKPEERIKEAKHKLAEQGHWLLIIDDAENYDSINDHLPSMPGHVLITSRHTEKWRNTLTLGVFSREESVNLLREILNSESADFKTNAGELANLLGDLPLALAQAGAYIKETGITITDYITLFKTRHQALWQREKSASDYSATVAVTWDISFKAAKERLGNEAHLLDKVVEHFAYLHTEAPRWLLATLLEDVLVFHDIVSALKAYSLITGTEKLNMHGLVQQVIRDKSTLTAEQVALWLTIVSSEDNTIQALEQQRALLPQYEVVETRVKHLHSPNVALFLGVAGASYLRLGQAATAVSYLARTLAIQEAHYGKDHLEVARTLSNLAAAYGDLGDAQQQKRLLERALPILESTPHKNDTNIATALNNLAYAYGKLGDMQQQKCLLERSLKIKEAHYGENHPDVARTLANLATAYGVLGDVRQKKVLLEQALPIFETHYGKNHPEVARTLNNLANAYSDLGDAPQKKALLEQALPIQEAYYGKNHPEVARTLANLATAYGELGDVRQTKALLERTLPILEAHYGENHPEVAITLANLSLAYLPIREFIAAQASIAKALVIIENHPQLPAGHPLIQQIRNIANAVQRKSRASHPSLAAAQSSRTAKLHSPGLFNKPGELLAELLMKYKISDASQKSLEKGLRNAACNNQLDDLKTFLQQVGNINASDDNPKSKRTALHWAVERGHKTCAELLLANGADASLVDANGQSPLILAQAKGDAELTSLLSASVLRSAGPG